MHLAFVDEFGCNRKYDKEIISQYHFHPTRGYAGVIIPSSSFSSFMLDFMLLKIIALRQIDKILDNSTKSIAIIKSLDHRIMDGQFSIGACRKLLLQNDDHSGRVRSSIIRAEIKSSDLLRRDPKIMNVRRRFIALMMECLFANECSVFYTGYEKKTIVVSPKYSGEYEYTMMEIRFLIDVLKNFAQKKNYNMKVFFDQHSIDEMKASPLARKREFDKIVQEKNYNMWFPETVTVDVESRYSLGMQAADWVCGIVSRYLSLEVEPKARSDFERLFNLRIRDLWGRLLSQESLLRHGRGSAFSDKLLIKATQLELPLQTI